MSIPTHQVKLLLTLFEYEEVRRPIRCCYLQFGIKIWYLKVEGDVKTFDLKFYRIFGLSKTSLQIFIFIQLE